MVMFSLNPQHKTKYQSDRYLMLLHVAITALLFVWFARFDPDPQHDGTQVGSAIGVAEGLHVHGEVFSQYGPISPWINGLLMSVFGHKLLVIRISTAVQLALIHYFIYKICVVLGVRKSLTYTACTVWLLCCPVWAYQKWFFQLWPWPSVTYMLLALAGTYLVLWYQKCGSIRHRSQIVAGILVGLAVMCRPNYGIPFVFLLVTFLVVQHVCISEFRLPYHFARGFVLALGFILTALVLTDSLSAWIEQSIVGPASAFLPQTLGWNFFYKLYIREQLILVAFVALFVLSTRLKRRIVTLAIGFVVIVGSSRFFYDSILEPLKVALVGGETEFLERVSNQLSTSIALRSSLFVSLVVAVIFVGSALRSLFTGDRAGLVRFFAVAPVIACWFGALSQLYPYPDLYHLWWTSPPLLILSVVGLNHVRWGAIRVGAFLFLLIPTLVNVAKIREQIEISRVRWTGGVLDGMLIDKDFYPSFMSANQFLQQIGHPADFDCRDGLWSVFNGDYVASGLDYVNWATPQITLNDSSPVEQVLCADPETAERENLLPLSALTSHDDSIPLSFSRWSGWFDFYLLR